MACGPQVTNPNPNPNPGLSNPGSLLFPPSHAASNKCPFESIIEGGKAMQIWFFPKPKVNNFGLHPYQSISTDLNFITHPYEFKNLSESLPKMHT